MRDRKNRYVFIWITSGEEHYNLFIEEDDDAAEAYIDREHNNVEGELFKLEPLVEWR